MMSPRLQEMMAEIGGENPFNYTIHIGTTPRFIFFSNPICACSTLKMTLNLSVARAEGRTDFAITSAAQIHKRRDNLLKTPRQVGYKRFEEMLDDPAVPVFTFVRSPESRLLSAWRKKLASESPFTRRVRAHLGIPPNRPLAEFLSPDDFAALVAKDIALRDLDEHWRLQRKQVFYDHVPRLEAGFVETFADDAQRILGRIFGDGGYVMGDIEALNPANASRNRGGEQSHFSEDALKNVALAYAKDVKMLSEIRERNASVARQEQPSE